MIKVIQILIAVIIMSTVNPVFSDKINISDSYNGMDDILIPDSPFKNKISYEKYRFEPIVLIDIPNDLLELDVFVYVNLSIGVYGETLKEVVNKWVSKEQNKYNVKFKIIKHGYTKINNRKTYYLEYSVPGYDDKRTTLHKFICRNYFFPINKTKTVMVYLIRREKNNKPTNLLKQWQEFISSIKYEEPNQYSSSVKGIEIGTRRYYTSDISFDLPVGLYSGLNKWRNKRRAVRGDDWQTPEGEISFRFQITSGYDFKPEKENENIKMKADALATGGSDFFELLDSNFSREYESIEHPFGKDHKIYGYKETGRVLTEVKLETAYKTGKTIQILIKTRNEIFEKYEKTIIEWLKHFVVLQET